MQNPDNAYQYSPALRRALQVEHHERSPALLAALNLTKSPEKIGISEERIKEILPEFTKYVSFWREYPDIFIDMLLPEHATFRFYFYQRLFLRGVMRHKYFYGTFPRAYSKSFLSMFALIIRCTLYPGSNLFIVAGTKEQGAAIAKDKIDEILDLVPALKNEINMRKSLFGKDYIRLVFKNGSKLDIVVAKASTRGLRRHGGLIEELILIDGKKLNEIIIPLMNVSRKTANGQVDDKETLNKSQIYVTTAGYKGTFAYEKLLQILIWQLVKPESAFVCGGTWRVPMAHKLLDRNFVKDLKLDGTFNETSFDREYESKWSGSVDGAFFSPDLFDRYRILKQPDYEFNPRTASKSYYILSVDVGRLNCQTVTCVFKITPQAQGTSYKSLVNMYVYNEEHFGVQAARIKGLYYRYNPRAIIIDGNGMGLGLLDFMVVKTEDDVTKEVYPPFGVMNDKDGTYKKHITNDTVKDIIYIIIGNPELNTEAHTNVLMQMSSGKVKLLIDERAAKARFLSTKVGQSATAEQRANYLKPFTLTSILKEEMLNLKENKDGRYIVLDPVNNDIKKDKFSAFEYGLYYIKITEDSKKRRRFGSITDFMFFSPGKK